MVIDTRGKICPEPLIITKRAISGAAKGSCFEVLSDNSGARTNLMSYLVSLGHSVQCTTKGGIFHITFAIGEEAEKQESRQEYAESFSCEPQRGYAVVIKGRTMGSGDDELGALLMRSCVNSLVELDNLPSSVVLYNSGVMLAVEKTDTAASLTALNQAGVEIIVCGTCVDYFGVKDQLAIGNISNMLTINNILARASHIIYP